MASAEQAAALEALRAQVPGLAVEIDPVTGATRSLGNRVGYLTGPLPGTDERAAALTFLGTHATLLGLTAADVASYEITDDARSRASGIRHLYLRQLHQGLPVYNGQLHVNVDRDGAILSINNQFMPRLAQSVNRVQPALTAEQAVVAAALQLQRVAGPVDVVRAADNPRRPTRLRAPALSDQLIDASLMLLPVANGNARMVWNFQLWAPGGGDVSDYTVDAESGQLWTRASWVADASYKVYPIPVESPQHTTPLPPADARVTVSNPENSASPFGWHDTDGAAGAESTLTIGNNVEAYADTNADNLPDPGSSPECTAALNCVFPLDLSLAPSTYGSAAVANLFYVNNVVHDVAHRFGFDEAAGNFQVNNYGLGGVGNDSVRAEAQDGSDINNADFTTPPEGLRPRMQMFRWTLSSPARDSSLDNAVIAHEYGHGISNRLVGGASNTSCLFNTQQAGEGLSDWWGLYFTQPNDTSPASRIRGIGTYLINQPASGQGLRQDYYDGDTAVNPEPFENTWTYQSITGTSVPHGVGSRWAQAYWQVNWALIGRYGYDADLDNFTGTAADKGNIRAMYYSIEGLKNTACNPTFTNIRDGILQAAAAAQPYNGADVCLMWEAFAEFGLGENAVSGGPNSTTPTNGFGVPNACRFLGSNPDTRKVCAGGNAVFPVTLGTSFVAPVNMGVSGNPAGTTASFASNPVATIPGASSLTIGNTGAVAPGNYNLTVTASHSGGPSQNLPLSLRVFNQAPGTPTLTAPANAATNVEVNPVLTWTASTQGDEYVVEIATDAGFTNIVYTRTLTGTSHTVQTALTRTTQYHWRVRPTNPCASGVASSTFTFTTQDFFCVSPNLAIPDNITVESEQSIATPGVVADLNVSIVITHPNLSDLVLSLRNQDTGTEVALISQSCDFRQNIDAVFDDEAPIPITCSVSVPGLMGTQQPLEALSAFDTQALNSRWRLVAADTQFGSTGTLAQWCLFGSFGAANWNGFRNGFE